MLTYWNSCFPIKLKVYKFWIKVPIQIGRGVERGLVMDLVTKALFKLGKPIIRVSLGCYLHMIFL